MEKNSTFDASPMPLNFKAVKVPILQNSKLLFPRTCLKIHPMPVIYSCSQQRIYDSQFDKSFALRGFKHLSKLVAVGHLTDKNLKRINKSLLKNVRNVEFDPYLCDGSALMELARVLTKLRANITNLDLTIRRACRSKELDILTFCLSRNMRLTKLKLELASSLSTSEESLSTMGKRIKKYPLLKSLEIKLVYLPNVGQKIYRDFALSYQGLLKLEELSHNIFTNHSPQNEYKDIPNKIAKLKKVKQFLLKTSAKTGWTSMTDGAGQFLPVFVRSFAERLNPIYFTHVFNNFAIPTEAVEEYAKMLPQLLELKYLSIEFSYCRLGDLELMILAEGLTHCRNIEHLTFKFIERTPIAFEYVCQFAKIIAELGRFLNFDLFFRKVEFSQQERPLFESILSKINNVEFVLTKESLHAFRRK